MMKDSSVMPSIFDEAKSFGTLTILRGHPEKHATSVWRLVCCDGW